MNLRRIAFTFSLLLAAGVASPAFAAVHANAGQNQRVNGGSPVTLDGSRSRSDEGETLTFLWQQTAGPTVSLSGADTVTPTFTAPPVVSNVQLRFQLTVSQPLIGTRGKNSDSANVNVQVQVPGNNNQPPTASAGPDRQVTPGAIVNLDGSGSTDPDGDPLTYLWTQIGGAAVLLVNPQQQIASFIAPPTVDPLNLIFSLTVNDGRGGQSTDDMVVQDLPAVNTAPSANAGPDRRVASTGTITLDGSGSRDPLGRPLTFLWTQIAGPPVALQNAASAVASFAAPAVAIDTLVTFQLNVTSAGGSAVGVVTVTLVPAAAPPPQPQQPQFSASVDGFSVYPNPFDPRAGNATLVYTLGADSDVTITIYDLFGRLVRELKPNGGRGTNRTFWDGRNGEGSPVGNGGYVVQVKAVDGSGHSARASDRVAVVR